MLKCQGRLLHHGDKNRPGTRGLRISMQSGIELELVVAGQEFPLTLCRRQNERFGPVEIDHWWMHVTPLYGQRRGGKNITRNHVSIRQHYWLSVEQDGSTAIRDAQERYLLASIVPYVRAEGSRNIFADAFLARGRSGMRRKSLDDLNSLLRRSCSGGLTRTDFREQSWKLLGRTTFPSASQSLYDRLSSELLDDPCRLLSGGDAAQALSLVQQNWRGQMNSIGRRANKHDEKIVLDTLSYEARAAFHQCYSNAWIKLLPGLAQKAGLSDLSRVFLQFWHTDCRDPLTGDSLFNGHVFALHPGTGPFAATTFGKKLLGKWLASQNGEEARESLSSLLNGLLVGIYDYAERRNTAAAERSMPRTNSNIERIPDEDF
jgi:hypothetical protein